MVSWDITAGHQNGKALLLVGDEDIFGKQILFRRSFRCLLPGFPGLCLRNLLLGKGCFHNPTSQPRLRRVWPSIGSGIYRNIRISMDRAIRTEKMVMMMFLFL